MASDVLKRKEVSGAPSLDTVRLVAQAGLLRRDFSLNLTVRAERPADVGYVSIFIEKQTNKQTNKGTLK